MKRISIRELQKSPGRFFQEAPVEVTSYGKTVGYIVSLKQYKKNLDISYSQKDPRWAGIEKPGAPLSALSALVVSLKTQEFSSSPVELNKCQKHGVYKQTCGCK